MRFLFFLSVCAVKTGPGTRTTAQRIQKRFPYFSCLSGRPMFGALYATSTIGRYSQNPGLMHPNANPSSLFPTQCLAHFPGLDIRNGLLDRAVLHLRYTQHYLQNEHKIISIMGPDCVCAIVRTLLRSKQGSNTTRTLGATKMKPGPVFCPPSLSPAALAFRRVCT